jgi:hypothetical protein
LPDFRRKPSISWTQGIRMTTSSPSLILRLPPSPPPTHSTATLSSFSWFYFGNWFKSSPLIYSWTNPKSFPFNYWHFDPGLQTDCSSYLSHRS